MAAEIRTDGLVDAERLRKTLALLRDAGPKGLTKLQLAKKLGAVSTRTVDRALGLLEEQGAKLERSREGRPAVLHFRLNKGPGWDEHVSSDARMALRLATMTLAQSGTLLWQDKLEMLEGLASAHMSTKDRMLFEALAKAVRVQGGVEDPIEGPEVLEPILRALQEERELEVDYLAAGAKASTPHRVRPYALTHDLYSGGAFLLVWDSKRQKPIHLRLNRIGRVKVGPKAVVPNPELMERAARFQIGGWTSEETPFEVVLRIEGAHWVQALKEVPPALPDFSSRIAKDGQSTEARFKATHSHGASRWILQLGEAAEVLEPAWLRKEIAERLEKALRAYKRE